MRNRKNPHDIANIIEITMFHDLNSISYTLKARIYFPIIVGLFDLAQRPHFLWLIESRFQPLPLYPDIGISVIFHSFTHNSENLFTIHLIPISRFGFELVLFWISVSVVSSSSLT